MTTERPSSICQRAYVYSNDALMKHAGRSHRSARRDVTERSHSDLVRMMLPLFGKYVYVQRFVHNQYLYERGMCNQALASALQSLLKVHRRPSRLTTHVRP